MASIGNIIKYSLGYQTYTVEYYLSLPIMLYTFRGYYKSGASYLILL